MKTLLFRNTTWLLIFSFFLTQIVPAGWAAAKPAEELQSGSVPASVAALEKPVTPTLAPAPQRIVGFVDSTAFQLGGSPLSVAVKDPEPSLTPDRVIPDHIIDPIIINPPITKPPLPSMPVVPPATIVTDPSTGREISVTVDRRGIAVVRWGDQEFRGVFDPRTNSVLLVTDDNSVWTVQFGKKEDGSLYLQTFQTEGWLNSGYTTEAYTFDGQGNLIRKEWAVENFFMIHEMQPNTCMGGDWCSDYWHYRSGGMIDYVTINGKTLVSHEKTWNEDNGRVSYEYTLAHPGDKRLQSEYLMPYPYGGRSETESWYSYDGQGNLLAKNWNTNDGYGGNTFGQEQYVHIKGRDLVSVRRIWQYGQPLRIPDLLWPIYNPIDWIYEYPVKEPHMIELVDDSISLKMPPYYHYSSHHSETYYNYDNEGNVIAEVNAWEGFDYNGQRKTGASYWVYNSKIGTWESASAEGLEIWQIRSVNDWKLIEAAAQRKTVYIGGGINRWDYKHRVEYTRNADGTMTAKAVYDYAGNVSIVVGQPDVLSGEADDIKFQNGQEVNGYRVYYQEHGHAMKPGWFNEGYRLVFFDANWNATAVDFPAQSAVILDGVEYKIKFDLDGKLVLAAALPPEVQTFVNTLKEMLKGYRVNWELKDGKYLIFVVEENSIHADIRLLNLSFTVSAEGVVDSVTVRATYGNSACDGEKCLQFATKTYEVDGERLLGVVSALEASFHPTGALWMNAPPYYYARLVSLMAQIIVKESDENLLRFDHEGKRYKAYWDAEGNMKLEQELPTGAQQAINDLADRLGLTPAQRAQIGLVQVFDGMWSDGCRDSRTWTGACTMATVPYTGVVLSLYGNTYVYTDGHMDAETTSAMAVIKDLMAGGVPLSEIKIGVVKLDKGPSTYDKFLPFGADEVSVSFNGEEWIYEVETVDPGNEAAVLYKKPVEAFPIAILDTPESPSLRPGSGSAEEETKKSGSQSSESLVVPALRFQNLVSYASFLSRFQGQAAARFVAGPSITSGAEASSLFLQQTTSLKSSPVFGFEQGSLLFGNILTELTR